MARPWGVFLSSPADASKGRPDLGTAGSSIALASGLAILMIHGISIAAAHANMQPFATDTEIAPIRTRGDQYRPLLMFLAAGLTAALLTLAFVVIGGEVAEGDTRGFDTQLLHFAQTLRVAHPGIAGVMRDLSGLGSTTVLTLFTLLAVSYLMIVSQRVTALLVASSVISGSILVSAFKLLHGRLRPDLSPTSWCQA